jgi:hypothetical protein
LDRNINFDTVAESVQDFVTRPLAALSEPHPVDLALVMTTRRRLSGVLILVLMAGHAHAAEQWTHLPDGRWMFVDPNAAPEDSQICDFEHQCYPAEPDSPKAAEAPTAEPPASPPPTAFQPPRREPGIGCDGWPLGSDADRDNDAGERNDDQERDGEHAAGRIEAAGDDQKDRGEHDADPDSDGRSGDDRRSHLGADCGWALGHGGSVLKANLRRQAEKRKGRE